MTGKPLTGMVLRTRSLEWTVQRKAGEVVGQDALRGPHRRGDEEDEAQKTRKQ